MRVPVSSGASAIGCEASALRGRAALTRGFRCEMSTEPQIAARSKPRSATRRKIALRIERISRRQKQIIRLAQLIEAGLSGRGVRSRIASRDLFRVHRGVFALHPPPYSWHQRLLAATFACGPGSAVSDLAAAHLLGATENHPPVPHVTNWGGRGRTINGIVVHDRSIDPRDLTFRFAIPCTTPARTLLDCAGSVGIEELEALLMAADSGRPGLDRARLGQLVAEHRGARGVRNLRELITDEPKETRAENERRMLRICRRFGVPEPLTNFEIRAGGRTFAADFCWPDLRLIVECDSWRWHGGKLKTERDRERDQLLAIAGWLVVHFTRTQIKLARDETGRKLVALTAAR